MYDYRNDKWIKLSNEVKKSNNNICSKCGIQSNQLDTHHMFYFHEDLTHRSYFNYLIPLCRKCHEEERNISIVIKSKEVFDVVRIRMKI